MAIFKRVRDIVSASINDLLARVEDPERVVNQMIREMEESILALRRETASAMASHKMLVKKLEKAKAECQTWRENAELAVQQKKDDLAKSALSKKLQAEALVKTIRAQVAEADGLVQRLKDGLRGVEDKVQEARAKRNTLVTKKRLAQYRSELARNVDRASRALPSYGSGADIIDGFERLEEKIEREVAEADARQQLDAEAEGKGLQEEFDQMKREKRLDAELNDLKKRLDTEL